MKAQIITIGDEILIGQTLDTNSFWMAKKLQKLGIEVVSVLSIADKREAILKALGEASSSFDLVLMTGGLGPTVDDITKSVLCEFFQTNLVLDSAVEARIRAYFSAKGLPMLESNLQQAMLPENCVVLNNALGTAQGMWFEREGSIFVSMPGVPHEMKNIMEESFIPRLHSMVTLPSIYYRTLMTEGIGESFLAEMIADWQNSLPGKGVSIAYLPSPGIVKIRLGAQSQDPNDARERVEKELAVLEGLIPEYIYGYDDQMPEQVLGEKLKQEGKTLGLAESCTGGTISRLMTAAAGSSLYFKGGIVSYSNEAKVALLGVRADDLTNYGAVSKEVVEQMALGAVRALNTDYAISTSGIAGPDGGTDEKPVGTVWIAVASKEKVLSKRFVFGKNREINIMRSARSGIIMLYKEIVSGSF